jgi:hypothetical protein
MNKYITYTYLGTNGTLMTPIHLEGIYSVKKIILSAEPGKVLTKDNKTFVKKITVKTEEEALEWIEVPEVGQK